MTNYYHKYYKYKMKYTHLQKNIYLDEYILNFFKTYNLISWNINKLYPTKENNKELIDFCKSNTQQLENCDPPYNNTNITKTIDDCCIFKNIGVSKRSIHRFNINSIIEKDSINFKFIKDYPQITTQSNKKIFYNYLKSLIIENISNISKTKYDNIVNILKDDNDYNITNINDIVDIINNDDFYEIDDILDIIYPNKEYINNDIYKKLKLLSDAKLPTYSIQENTNKLFQQIINNKNTYYFYFSYGTLNNIELIKWQDSLKIYVKDIINLLNDDNTEHIILAGHSVGSIVIQHLAIELLNNIMLTKLTKLDNIFIIGSGCRLEYVLNDDEFKLFKNNFKDRYFFVINAYIDKDKIYYDHRNNDDKINKINTHMMICQSNEFKNNYNNCKSVKFDIIDHNNINKNNNYIPCQDILLHDFSVYAKLYLDS